MKKSIFNSDVIFPFFILIVSVCFFAMGAVFNKPTADGHIHEGFFPQVLAGLVGILSVSIIINGIRKNPIYFKMDGEQKKNLKLVLKMAGLFIAYVIAWPFVHFIIITLLLLLGMCRLLRMSMRFTVIFSAVFAVGIYFLFTEVFSILL